MTSDDLDEALKEISLRRFAGVYRVEREGVNFRVWPGCGYPYGFHCWLRSKRKVEFRPDPGEWAHWVTAAYQEEIAAKFKGKCSDEGIPEIWDPVPGRHPTFKSFWTDLNEIWIQDSFLKGLFARQLWKATAKRIPEELRKFVT